MFNKHACCKNAKGLKCRLMIMFQFCTCCLEFLHNNIIFGTLYCKRCQAITSIYDCLRSLLQYNQSDSLCAYFFNSTEHDCMMSGTRIYCNAFTSQSEYLVFIYSIPQRFLISLNGRKWSRSCVFIVARIAADGPGPLKPDRKMKGNFPFLSSSFFLPWNLC